MDYKFVTGLFDNTTLKNTPYLLSKAKAFLFDSIKIIIPVEFNNELELQNKLRKFIKTISIPSTNYIIQRIEKSKNGNGMEPFMEYLACEIIKKKGFIVETQIPLTHNTGSPDFGGYRLGAASRIIPNKIHLLELSLKRLGIEKKIKTFDKNWLIVGEAKTSTKEIKKQLDKYLDTGLFDEGFEIHPNKFEPSSKYTNLLTIGSDYKIKIIEKKDKLMHYDIKRQNKYVKWLNNYIKYYLIANLTNDEFIEFYNKTNNDLISCQEDVVSFVNKLSFKQIINKIKDVIKNGFFK